MCKNKVQHISTNDFRIYVIWQKEKQSLKKQSYIYICNIYILQFIIAIHWAVSDS